MPVNEPDLDVKEQLRGRLQAMNSAWLSGRFEALKECFHPDVVMVAPGFAGRISGADACVRSFEQFGRAAVVHDFRESELQVEHWQETAVVSFRFDIDYELDGRRFVEAGREIWVWRREAGTWSAVWRTQLSA